MVERGLKNNYIFTLVKFLLFLIIFCFLTELTKEFWKEISGKEHFNINVLIVSVISSFSFYYFLADLNAPYQKIQNFFFRASFFSLIFSSLLIILGIAYFFFPKILNLSFNKNIFVFIGGFVFTCHLIFISKEIKGHTFSEFINYLFIFSILYILNLILLGLYLKNAYNIDIGRVALEGMRNGAILMQNTFTQILK